MIEQKCHGNIENFYTVYWLYRSLSVCVCTHVYAGANKCLVVATYLWFVGHAVCMHPASM